MDERQLVCYPRSGTFSVRDSVANLYLNLHLKKQ